MKKYILTLTILLACTFLASCGDKAEQEGPWIGIAPGADLTAVTERTEYYDLNVKTEEVFDLGLWEKNPEEYYQSDISNHGVIVYSLLGMQFVMEEPAQLWAEASSDGVNIYLYRTDGSRELLLQEFSAIGYQSTIPQRLSDPCRNDINTCSEVIPLLYTALSSQASKASASVSISGVSPLPNISASISSQETAILGVTL